MKKLAYLVSIFVVSLGITGIFSDAAHSLSASDFTPGHLIDDAVMRDHKSMSVSEIQRFIEAKQPGCEPNHEETTNWKDFGQPYTCLENYKEDPGIPIEDCTSKQMEEYGFDKLSEPDKSVAKGYCWWTRSRANLQGQSVSSNAKSAAEIIYDAGQKYKINPQVLLVIIQKEQSLLTDVWPWVGQYQKTMGYACPDTDKNNDGQPDCDPAYRGLYNQINSAADMLDRIMNKEKTNYYPPGKNDILYYLSGSGCGQSEVNIKNLATSALYNYTPYQPNQSALDYKLGGASGYDSCATFGNLNFWLLFHNWFGTPTPSKDIVTMTSPSTSKIYLISGDKKVHIANPTAYKAWGLDKIPVTQVEDSVLSSYSESTHPLRRLAKSKQSGVIYLVDNQQGYSFPDKNRADVWGIDISKRPTIDNLPIKNLVDRRELPVIVNSPVGHEKYLMDGGRLRHFPNATVLNAWESNQSSITPSEAYFCKGGTSGDSCDYRWPEGGRLWSNGAVGPDGKNYIIDRDNKHIVADGLKGVLFDSHENVSQVTIDRKSTKEEAQAVIKVKGSPHIYLANGGELRRFASPSFYNLWRPQKHSKVFHISPELGKQFTEGDALDGFTANDGTETYYVNGGKHKIDSKLVNAYTARGKTETLSADTLTLYSNKKASPFVTSSNTSKIFFVNAGGTKHHIGTLNEYKLFKNGTNLPTVSLPSELLDSIENGVRARYQFTSGEDTYLFDDGGYHKVLSDEWGLGSTFVIDSASLGWFEQKADLTSHFKNGNSYGIVRGGTIYTSTDKALGSLWGASDSSPVVGSSLVNMFEQKTMSPFVDSSNSSNPRIYVYDGTSLFHIPNLSAWKNLGLNWFGGGRVTLSENQVTSLVNGRSTYILSSSNGLVEDGVRRSFATTDAASAWVTADNQKYAQKLIDFYSQKSADQVDRLITSSETNRWYCIENGEKRWVTSFSALSNSSCSDQSVGRIGHDLLKQVPLGDNIN